LFWWRRRVRRFPAVRIRVERRGWRRGSASRFFRPASRRKFPGDRARAGPREWFGRGGENPRRGRVAARSFWRALVYWEEQQRRLRWQQEEEKKKRLCAVLFFFRSTTKSRATRLRPE